VIGLSLSLCVRDIVEGRVALADVEKIVTGTFYTDRAAAARNPRTSRKATGSRSRRRWSALARRALVSQPALWNLLQPPAARSET
jgi:hypothetical protein